MRVRCIGCAVRHLSPSVGLAVDGQLGTLMTIRGHLLCTNMQLARFLLEQWLLARKGNGWLWLALTRLPKAYSYLVSAYVTHHMFSVSTQLFCFLLAGAFLYRCIGIIIKLAHCHVSLVCYIYGGSWLVSSLEEVGLIACHDFGSIVRLAHPWRHSRVACKPIVN